MTSTMCRESRIIPDTTSAPHPTPWSFMAFSQVMPRRDPKNLRLGRANAAGTRTTNRIPSTAAAIPPPHAFASGSPAWRAAKGRLAGARVSGRKEFWNTCDGRDRSSAGRGDRPVPDVQRVRRQARGDRGGQVLKPGPATGHRGERRSRAAYRGRRKAPTDPAGAFDSVRAVTRCDRGAGEPLRGAR
jgi:hypothetical protein